MSGKVWRSLTSKYRPEVTYFVIRFNEAPAPLKATCVPFVFEGKRVRTAGRPFKAFHAGTCEFADVGPSTKASTVKRSRKTAAASSSESMPPLKKRTGQSSTLHNFGFVDREMSKAEVSTFHSLLAWMMCSLALPFRFVNDYAFHDESEMTESVNNWARTFIAMEPECQADRESGLEVGGFGNGEVQCERRHSIHVGFESF